MEDLTEVRKKITYNSFNFWTPLLIIIGIASLIPVIQLFYIDRIGWSRFGGVAAFCYVAALLVAIFTLRKDFRNRRRWKELPLVKATVTDCISAGYTKRNRLYYTPTVKLNFKGQEVTFTATEILRRKKYQKGEVLHLFFDPKQPSSSFDLETTSFLSMDV